MAAEAFQRRLSKQTSVDNTKLVEPSNPLQSDFTETSSMDSDEQYLVRSSGP